MATLKMSVLRRTAYFVQNFGQCVVTDLYMSRCRMFNTRKSILSDNNDVATKLPKKPKKIWVPRITLFLPDDSMLVTDMENAQRLAKRRKLILEKVCDLDSKTQRATYKLISSSSILESINDKDNSCHINHEKRRLKTPKILYLTGNITEHDLMTKIRSVVKALNKGNRYKIYITLNDTKEDYILGIITGAVKNDGNIQKIPSKKNTVLLLISPLSNEADNPVDNKNKITT